MIAPAKPRRRKPLPAWHTGFLAMLPVIRQYAIGAFGHRNPEARQDLIQEVIANALVAYVRLYQQGRVTLAYPTVLARYGIAQVRDGRRVGSKLNVRDVSSGYCQKAKGVTLERLDRFDEEQNQWEEVVVEDRHAGPAETAAARLDIADWFASLPKRKRRIAAVLATRETTTRTARKFKVSPGRISQTRRELEKSWGDFQGDAVVA